MKKLPISIQTFEEIISKDMIYVDKTAYIWELTQSGKFYFLSRPRRFGKSLLLSTLKSYFEGKANLFEGLDIFDKEIEWKEHPIIQLDYALIQYRKDTITFEASLLSFFKSVSKEYGLTIEETILLDFFRELVIQLYNTQGSVVILVDEYDKPLVDLLTNEEQFYENAKVISGLYATMKSLDPYLQFVMLTGVSRFVKANVFSGLNNLDDISLSGKYSQIVGFSQDEIEQYFEPYLQRIQEKFHTTRNILLETIRFQYIGSSWDGQNRLYNPFSFIKFLSEQEFGNYWFASGTPSFLIQLIKEQKHLPEQFEQTKTNDLEGGSVNIKNLPLLPLLFQTGYLTISKIDYDGFQQRFYLDYPNEEVRHSFLTYLLAGFTKKDEFEIRPEAVALRDALIEEKPAIFIQLLQSFIADIPARLHLEKEAYYHSLVYMVFRLVGMQLLLEKETDKGRIDAVLELPDKVYIIEFKFATDKRTKRVATLAQKALKQISEKKYYEAYLGSGKKVILVGIGFLSKELGWKLKKLNNNF